MKNVYFLYFAISIFCIFGVVSYTRPVLAAAFIMSTNDQTCTQTCTDYGMYCVGITTTDNNYDNNHNYCYIDYETGGDSYCAENTGNCSTVLSDDGYGGCNTGADNCTKYSGRQAEWTNCICQQHGGDLEPDPFRFFTVLKSQLQSGSDVPLPASQTGEQRFNIPLASPDTSTYWDKIYGFTLLMYNWGDYTSGANLQAEYMCKYDCSHWGSPLDPYVNYQEILNYQLMMGINPSTYQPAYFGSATDYTTPDDIRNDLSCNPSDPVYLCGFQIFVNDGDTSIAVASTSVDEQYFFPDMNASTSVYAAYFKIAGETTTTPQTATSTFCHCSDNEIIQAICNGLCWAFVPNDYATSSLSANYNKLKLSFPFNTYFQLTDTIQNAISSTTINTNSTFSVPLIKKVGHTPTFYMQSVLSSSSLPNAIAGYNANAIRNGLSYLIWIITAGIAVILFIKL